jgi:hypothetical protein
MDAGPREEIRQNRSIAAKPAFRRSDVGHGEIDAAAERVCSSSWPAANAGSRETPNVRVS